MIGKAVLITFVLESILVETNMETTALPFETVNRVKVALEDTSS